MYSDEVYKANQTTINVEYLFEKKFAYKQIAQKWTLSPPEELFAEFYQFENFQKLKDNLNTVKSRLNDYVIEDWSIHTRKQDPSSEIPWKLKNEIKAEFVTVAWCKLFECLHQYKIVKSGKLNSLHLCEAPGAFIAALNHYLHSTYNDVNWNWLSTTRNPYYEGNPPNEMIMDDRFMLHTLDRWLFHEDFSGNIIDVANIQHMAKECKERLGDVHLITADGSVDCIETPDNQESFVSKLHFAEVCTALLILSEGGSFVLKMFTLFEANSVSLVYLLNCVFEEVNVFKPATSKRGNSEVYLICLNYQKPDNFQEYLDIMLSKVETQNILPIFPSRCIPNDFCMQHEVCTRRFMFEQISAIEDNIYTYDLNTRWLKSKCHHLRSIVCNYFFKLYRVQPIEENKKILQNPHSKFDQSSQTRIYFGSHNQRICLKNLSTEQQVFALCKALNDTEKKLNWQYGEMACFHGSAENRLPLKLYKGKPIKELHSSLFVSVEILLLRSKIQRLFGSDPIWHSETYCKLQGTKNSVIYDVHIPSRLSSDFGQQQQVYFSDILKAIIDHKPQSISFKNYAFLTHYSISILSYLTANMYDTCRVSGTLEITLEMQQECDEEAIQSVRDLYKVLTENPDVLCFVDIVHLHRNLFFTVIRNFNNQLLISNYKNRLSTE